MSPGLPWTPPRRDLELGATEPAQSRAAAAVCSAPSGSSAGRHERLLVRSPTLRSAQHHRARKPQHSSLTTLTTRHAPGHTLSSCQRVLRLCCGDTDTLSLVSCVCPASPSLFRSSALLLLPPPLVIAHSRIPTLHLESFSFCTRSECGNAHQSVDLAYHCIRPRTQPQPQTLSSQPITILIRYAGP